MIPLILATVCGVVGPLAAQERVPPRRGITITDSVYTRITTFSPHSGPAGTDVLVKASSLPAVTPVQITIGGTRSGFEVLSQLMSNRRGEISDTVTIPAWAKRDGTYMFIVVDMYFEPLAASEIFHVTGPEGTILREGRISEHRAACPAMRGEDGELYTLTGETGHLESGDAVIVEGTIVESTVCTHGTTIEVIRIRPDPARP